MPPGGEFRIPLLAAILVCHLVAQVRAPVPVQIPGGGQTPAPRDPSDPRNIPSAEIPMPRLPRIPTPRLPRLPGGKKPQAEGPGATQEEFGEITGVVREVQAAVLILDNAEGAAVHLRTTSQTRYLRRGEAIAREEVSAGTPVLAEVQEDEFGRVFALFVHVHPGASRKPREPREDDGDQPPVLRRRDGPAPARPLTTDRHLVDRAREEVFRFTDTLPNYICDQVTTRFEGGSRDGRWRKKDVVTAEVLSVDGVERYQNVRVGGAPASEAQAIATGSWSTGEFLTTMRDVFSPATAAAFVATGTETVGRTPVRVFSFEVDEAGSHWQTRVGEQKAFPPYRGAVRIDPVSARVFRIEMESLRMPADFPIEWGDYMVEYGWVRIDGAPHLLPVRASNTSCWRSGGCVRNEIEFRNYRKFTAESAIYTTESTIEFETGKKKPD